MKTKSIILLVAAFWFALVGFVLLLSEPAPGEWLDSLMGIILMKAAAILNLAIVAFAWFAIPEQDRKRIDSWVNLHFN
jgi:uncharacterized membrane protein